MTQKEEEVHEFKVGGNELRVSRNGADYKLGTIKKPEQVRKYYVKYKGEKIPIKQALNALDPDFMRAGFNSTQAIGIFRKLGFEVGQESE
jgi:hypothetical protein